MKTFNTRGLVLREYEAGESDKRLLLLCKGVGRLFAYARGARKPKSKFIAATQLFTYGDFVLAQGRGFYSLTQATPIETFYNLRTDYDTLCAAHVIIEICEKTVMADENCDSLLQLTLRALQYLSKSTMQAPQPLNTGATQALQSLHRNTADTSSIQILAVFMLRFFAWYGVAPPMDICPVCGCEIPEGSLVYNNGITGAPPLIFCAEGIICQGHTSAGYTLPLSPSAFTALRYIFNHDDSTAFRFTATPAVVQELQKAAFLLWRHHFDIQLNAARYLI